MSDKFWREVQEILERAERQGTTPRPRRTLLRIPRMGLTRIPLPRPTFAQLMLVALMVIVLGYVLGSLGDAVGRVLVLGGLGTFALVFLLSLRRASQPPEKRWRGQPLDLRLQKGPRLLSWLERWRGRR